MVIKRKKILFTLSILIVIVIAAIIGTVLFLNEKNKLPLSSQQNIDLMNEARQKKDPKICNQIRGGVEPPEKPKLKGVNVYIKPIPPMTESEAREQCKKDVQWTIDHQDE